MDNEQKAQNIITDANNSDVEKMDSYSRQKREAALTYERQGKYLSTPVNRYQLILLICSVVASIFLIILLIIFLSSKYQRFYFDNRPITYVFFVLIGLLGLSLAGLAVLNAMASVQLPSYDEYKRMSRDIQTMKSLSRFPELLDFDQNHPTFEKVQNETTLSLRGICNTFRCYMSENLHLYYSIEDVRRFISSLAVSKMMILQGMSGTGKTSISIAFGKFIGVESVVVPIQPMWKEKSDLLGYYNEFTGKFNETTILKLLYEASNSNKIFVVVLDEMNIARVEYYFSEFLSLLELPNNADRDVVVASSGVYGDPKRMSHGKIPLPSNVWFLGTANNDDSTFAISDKVYDRAMVMNLNQKTAPFEADAASSQINLSADRFEQLTKDALTMFSLSQESEAKINELDEFLIKNFEITFGSRILMQMRKYVPIYMACGGSEIEAIDDIICKKLLRKLEGKNPVYVRSKSEELLALLDRLFGEDAMSTSIEYIKRLTTI